MYIKENANTLGMCMLSLFLLVSFSFGQLSGSLLSDTSESLVGSGQSQSSVSGFTVVLDSSGTLLTGWLGNWESSGSRQDLLGLWSLTVSWEDNYLGLVFLQSLHVQVEDLLVSVLTSVVNSDTNGSSVSWGQTSGLNLGQSETSASSHLSVVLDGWRLDNWSQQVQWSWGNLGGLGSSGVTSRHLLTGLVEVHLDALLPVLSEVVLQDW